MKQPGQPPNWQNQQQQRMRQQQQQWRQRQAAGYAWQKEQERKKEAERLQAQQWTGQQEPGAGWQDANYTYASMQPQPRQRSCLGQLVRTVGILIVIGICLMIAVYILNGM